MQNDQIDPMNFELTSEDVTRARIYFCIRGIWAFIGLCLALIAPVEAGPFISNKGQLLFGLAICAPLFVFYYFSKPTWAILALYFKNLKQTYITWFLYICTLCCVGSYAANGQGFIDWSTASKIIALSGGTFFFLHLCASINGLADWLRGAALVKFAGDLKKFNQ